MDRRIFLRLLIGSVGMLALSCTPKMFRQPKRKRKAPKPGKKRPCVIKDC